nr:reverse transcriptase domain-containing protein [Tanacetum cinerariifolium]
MMSPGGSIVASLENVKGFLTLNIQPDDLICTDFKQEGIVPKVMLHIFEEFVLLLRRHSLNNKDPRMEENPSEQSCLGIFFRKEIFEGGVIRIHNAFVHDEGGPIAPIPIQAMNFGLKNDMIQQVQNSCQFHGLSGDDANKHLDKFLHVTQSIKVNGVTDDAFRLYLFPYSLTHHATAWFDRFPRNSINTFEKMAKMFLGKYFPPSMVTKLRNEITNFRQRPDESLFEA